MKCFTECDVYKVPRDLKEEWGNLRVKSQYSWSRNNVFRRLGQDGGVEGCALTPSCENTRITTNC